MADHYNLGTIFYEVPTLVQTSICTGCVYANNIRAKDKDKRKRFGFLENLLNRCFDLNLPCS